MRWEFRRKFEDAPTSQTFPENNVQIAGRTADLREIWTFDEIEGAAQCVVGYK